MTTITITLPDERLRELKDTASQLKVSPEELVRISIEELLYHRRSKDLSRQTNYSRHARNGFPSARPSGSGNGLGNISERWSGSIPKEAIAEAVRLSSQAFLEHAPKYVASTV